MDERKIIVGIKASVNLIQSDPNYLLDTLIVKLQLKNDAALSRILGVSPPVISKIRHRKLAVGASMLLYMHEASGLSLRELRKLMVPK